MTLFLCGDVMTGRGIDQVLSHPSDPRLFEPYVGDAREYVALAEARNGPVARPVGPAYVWGDALPEFERVAPDARIVNLETSITRSDERWRAKDIHYRMHPANVDCLTAARIDVCGLANNHVLDFGGSGLAETLDTLHGAGLKTAGAGRNLEEARAPAIVPLSAGSRLLIFAFGTESSGILPGWTAGGDRAGVDVLPDLSEPTAAAVLDRIRRARGPQDLVVASIHWGSNWGYEVPPAHVRFARWLVDGGVDVVYGHSSHHPRPIEVYKDRLILYGCGDFIDDYEGIEGYDEYRDDLVLMYFVKLSATTRTLESLSMTPMQHRRLTLNGSSEQDTRWLRDVLARICEPFESRVDLAPGGTLALRW